jgi:hypothetical protein
MSEEFVQETCESQSLDEMSRETATADLPIET